MEKHFRDFTVGELIDAGFKIEAVSHGFKDEQVAKYAVGSFEGIEKDVIYYPEIGSKVVKGSTDKFEVKIYL